jgi:hypothetical protein
MRKQNGFLVIATFRITSRKGREVWSAPLGWVKADSIDEATKALNCSIMQAPKNENDFGYISVNSRIQQHVHPEVLHLCLKPRSWSKSLLLCNKMHDADLMLRNEADLAFRIVFAAGGHFVVDILKG